MSSILARLYAEAGITEAPKSSLAGQFFAREGVKPGPEFLRIRGLPRRDWEAAEDLDRLVPLMTEWLARPDGRMKLLPMQAAALRELHDHRRLSVVANVGSGKAQPCTEPVPTPDGWRTMGDLRVGDRVFGSDGKPCTVTGVFPQGLRPVYRLKWSDDTESLSDIDHIWPLYIEHSNPSRRVLETLTVRQLLESPLKRKPNNWKYTAPVCGAVEYPDRDLPVDPYTLGAIIGDGGVSQEAYSFTSMDLEVVDRLRLGPGVEAVPLKCQNSGKATTYALRSGKGRPNPLKKAFTELRLHGCLSVNKFIPRNYLEASVAQRLELLRGLMDTDGHISPSGAVELSFSSQQLALDTCELVRSLGGICTVRVHKTTHADSYRMAPRLPLGMNPFHLSRHRDVYDAHEARRQRQRPRRTLVGLEFVEDMECVCISVDAADHCYLTKHYVVTHNTLITALAPTVLEAKRPLFLTYKKLLAKTIRDFRLLAEDWRIAQNYTFMSVESLSNKSGAEALERYQPDLIVCDEAHSFKSLKSTRTRRLDRFMTEHPECVFLPLTGTPGDDSVNNIAHIQRWVHGLDHAPLPQSYMELSAWADALDASVMVRTAPGCLTEFSDGSVLLSDVRAGVGRRIAQTPGNIYYRQDSVACSLYIDARKLEEVDPEVEKVFAYVREHEDEMPDGRVIDTPIERWRTFYTLGLGFVHIIDPPPPKPWREARRLYNAYVREVLAANEPGLDQPMLVGEACAAGRLNSGGLYEAWKEIEPTFKANSKIIWYDDSALKYCAKWAESHHGLVWTPYPAFGKKLAEMTNLPFFHKQGICTKFGDIEEYHGKTSAIVSTQANAMGRNLQDRWHKMLIVGPSAKADLLEQQIGRCHRQGQLAESVEVSFLLTSIETWEALQKARFERSEFDKDFGQAVGSKLRGCDWLVADGAEVAGWPGSRWQK